jgi:hypothetical protein
MTEQTGMKPAETDEQPMACHTWKRRGLIAAAWAAVAAIVARQTTDPVQAGVDGDVVLGASNTETSTTRISTAAAGNTLELVNTSPGNFNSLLAVSPGDAVWGQTNSANGGGSGVIGTTDFSSTRVSGVRGYSDSGVGVLGQSFSGIAIRGEAYPGTSANTIAIYGVNNSSYAGPSPGAGGFAIYGLCAKGHGLVGATATAGGAAVVGATNGVTGAYAGAFYGPVIVGGGFTVFGAKSAAVPHPDGTHRRLYCVESPESWFEDFGEGTLACGQAEVRLDPDFAAVVDLAKYHVFLTQYDEHNVLCVSERSANGFLVKANDDSSSGAFSWRVVAKRKDISAPRFETVTVPSEPVLPSLPEAPVAPVPRGSRASTQPPRSMNA